MNLGESHNLLGGAHNLKGLVKISGSERKSDRSSMCTDGPGFRSPSWGHQGGPKALLRKVCRAQEAASGTQQAFPTTSLDNDTDIVPAHNVPLFLPMCAGVVALHTSGSTVSQLWEAQWDEKEGNSRSSLD